MNLGSTTLFVWVLPIWLLIGVRTKRNNCQKKLRKSIFNKKKHKSCDFLQLCVFSSPPMLFIKFGHLYNWEWNLLHVCVILDPHPSCDFDLLSSSFLSFISFGFQFQYVCSSFFLYFFRFSWVFHSNRYVENRFGGWWTHPSLIIQKGLEGWGWGHVWVMDGRGLGLEFSV